MEKISHRAEGRGRSLSRLMANEGGSIGETRGWHSPNPRGVSGCTRRTGGADRRRLLSPRRVENLLDFARRDAGGRAAATAQILLARKKITKAD